MHSNREKWEVMVIFAVIITVDLGMMALCLHQGYDMYVIRSWGDWGMCAALCVPAMLFLTVYCDSSMAFNGAVFGMLGLILTPLFYLYSVVYEGHFNVIEKCYLWVGPLESVTAVLLCALLTFVRETMPRTA